MLRFFIWLLVFTILLCLGCDRFTQLRRSDNGAFILEDGGPPPDWTINTPITLSDKTVVVEGDLNILKYGALYLERSTLTLKGNLSLYGGLEMRDSVLEFDMSRDEIVTFIAEPGSRLVIHNSTLTSTVKCTNWRIYDVWEHLPCKNWGWHVATGDYSIISSDISYQGLTLPGPLNEAMNYWIPYDARFSAGKGGVIMDNHFHHCGAVNCIVFNTPGGEAVRAKGTIIKNNRFTEDVLCCLSIEGGEDIKIENNSCSGDIGVFNDATVNVDFTNNYFYNESYSGCVVCLSAGDVNFENNTFSYGHEHNLPILDHSGESLLNSLGYSNEHGAVRWRDRTDLSISTSLSLGDKILIENNRITLTAHPGLRNLMPLTEITFNNLSCTAQPILHKEGLPCAANQGCTVTAWESGQGSLSALVESFGLYTTVCP